MVNVPLFYKLISDKPLPFFPHMTTMLVQYRSNKANEKARHKVLNFIMIVLLNKPETDFVRQIRL
jgi:hypothetical protein